MAYDKKNQMTVGDLKKALKDAPDNLPVSIYLDHPEVKSIVYTWYYEEGIDTVSLQLATTENVDEHSMTFELMAGEITII